MSQLEKQKLIDQLSEFIPTELESTDEEKVLILVQALGAGIRELKQTQGTLMIKQKLAEDGTPFVDSLVKNKEQLAKLFADWKLLGGGQSEGEEEG